MKLAIWGTILLTALTAPIAGQGRITPSTQTSTERPKETPFASEIAAFEEADKKQMPPSEGILFIGSSSIRLWKTLAEDMPGLPTINRGFGGSQIADSVFYADRIVFPYKPKMIVMYAGGNDINAGKSPEQVLKDFQEFEGKVHAKLPKTRIVYISINPSVARWKQETEVLQANRLIRKFIKDKASKTRSLTYIDSHSRLLSKEGEPQPSILQKDGLHLNPDGYKAWTAILKPPLMKLWKADAGK